jgi:threonine dehydratase
VVVPVGGGGLLAGVATAVKALRPAVRVIAVEPENAAGFLAAQICGQPTRTMVLPTLADGLAVARVGDTTFAQSTRLVDDVVTVTEAEVAAAIVLLATECGAVVEGAGATALAAVLAGKTSGRAIVVPITGRNIDPHVHQRVLAEAAKSAAMSPIARAA